MYSLIYQDIDFDIYPNLYQILDVQQLLTRLQEMLLTDESHCWLQMPLGRNQSKRVESGGISTVDPGTDSTVDPGTDSTVPLH